MLGRPIGSIGPTRARCLERLKKLLPPGFDPKEGCLMPVSDDELLELVGRALRAADPVPDRVHRPGARAAWTWRTIDEELAELVFDSAAELTGVRSEDTARQLTFRAPGMEIEVMVVDEASRRDRRPARSRPGRSPSSCWPATRCCEEPTDRLGRFSFDAVAPGPVRLAVVDPDGTHVVTTEWILL